MGTNTKNKIISLIFIAAISVCGVFSVGLNTIEAQETEWTQVNANGFGDPVNWTVNALATFGNYIYAGTTYNGAGGAEIYRSSDGSSWTRVVAGGFGDVNNSNIESLISYNGYIYAGTWNNNGTEIWRSSNGTVWNPVVADEVDGDAVGNDENGFGNGASALSSSSMEVYNGYLYIGVDNSGVLGGNVYRSNNGTAWTQVHNIGGVMGFETLEVFNSNLYLGTKAGDAEVWRCPTCNVTGNWTQVADNGFGDGLVLSINELIKFGSYIYAGTDRQVAGAEVHRSSNGSSWAEIVGNTSTISGGFGDSNNGSILSSYVLGNYIYFGTNNVAAGTEIWRSNNGTTWNAVIADEVDGDGAGNDENGFGDSDNSASYSMIEFNSHLYIGTQNTKDGGELWQLNNIPEGSGLSAIQSDDGDGKVNISFTISDEENDSARAQVQYNVGSGWQDPTLSTSEISATSGSPTVNNASAYQISNINTPDVGNTVSLVWDSSIDEGDTDEDIARIRIKFDDDLATGAASDWIVTTFDLDNVAPNPPTLNPVTSPTNITPQVISGGKDANTSVLLNDRLIVAINASEDWSYSLNLFEGVNNFNLTSRDDKGNESVTTSGSIILDTTAPNTEANPPGGTYVDTIDEVILSADEAGTVIYYTTDGTDPDLSSSVYSDPIEISDNTTLKFFGVDSLGNQESINEEAYIITEANIRLTKSVSIDSAAVSMRPSEFKLSGFIASSFNENINNLKLVFFNSFKATGNHKIFNTYLLFISVIFVVLVLLTYILGWKDKKILIKNYSTFKLIFCSYKKLYLGLIISITIFSLSGLLLTMHLLSAADADVERGDILVYKIDYQNIGEEDVNDFYFVDSIPAFTEYVAESMKINDVVMTDEADIDSADFNNSWLGHVYFNIGDLTIGSSGSVLFKVKVSDIATNDTVISNIAVGGYNPGSVRVESNTVTNTVKVESSDDDSGGSGSTDGSTTSSTGSRGGSVVDTATEDYSDDNVENGTGDNVDDTNLPNEDEFASQQGNNINREDIVESDRIIEEIKSRNIGEYLIDINKYAIAPTLSLLALLNLLSTFSLSNLVPLIRYIWQLFTEPLLYFGGKKRKGWGVVYDSLKNKPIDLALVRLFDYKSKKLIETKVTDFEGRYMFVVENEGEYYLEVQKAGYTFPSVLVGTNKDGNLYKGGTITTNINNSKKDKGYIACNIPLDIKEGTVYSEDLPHKLLKTTIKNEKDISDVNIAEDNNKFRKAIKYFNIHKLLAYIGPVLGLVSFAITPSWLTFVLLLLHILLLVMFSVLAHKKESKSFGKVFNINNKNSISKSVIRLFDSKYGKLLSTTVSKSDGRYGFLVGDNKYLLNSTKKGYIFPKEKLEIESKKEGVIKEDLGMEKE